MAIDMRTIEQRSSYVCTWSMIGLTDAWWQFRNDELQLDHQICVHPVAQCTQCHRQALVERSMHTTRDIYYAIGNLAHDVYSVHYMFKYD